jgi:hypothetical protein
LTLAVILAAAFYSPAAQAANRQLLPGHVPHGVADSTAVRALPRNDRMTLAIGLPLRNQAELDQFLKDVVDPASPYYRQYLTPAQFAERFGPTEANYQALAGFFESNGLSVTATHPNRMILDVSGTVVDIQSVFHVNMISWHHPTRGAFFAPDREPSLDAGITILDVTGLDNFVLPRPMDLKVSPLSSAKPQTTGSGPSGLFTGNDFRKAYAPAVTLSGAGQSVGLFELDGFYASDVQANFQHAGLSPVPVQTVLLDGFSGAAGSANVEVTLDIMMAAYMAPGLSNIIVYEGTNWNDVLNRMATDNRASQLSSSWCFSPTNATTEQIFSQMIAQGQSLFQASGDSGAYTGWIMPPADDPNVTVVGGTSLTTAGPGGAWQAETAWSGSGGGVSQTWPIPSYQQSTNVSAAGGSTSRRNIPDVALTADVQLFLICNNGQWISVGGTSAAAPLWAGFLALANQQAVANRKPTVGFLNPIIYGIGAGSKLQTDLHDITTGTNGYHALPGYDLATGWGSPQGQPLIDDLSGLSNQPAFGLSLSASTLSVAAGASASAIITVGPQNGFSDVVNLAVTGLPAGVTASFSPAAATTGSTLTLTAGSSAPSGTSTVTITGTSGNLTGTARLQLTLAGVPSFSITAAPASVSLAQGASSAAVAITATGQNGFSGAVTLSASGLPSGVTAAFTATSTSKPGSLAFTATSSATLGTFSVIITGVSGSQTVTTGLSLTITSPPTFTIAAAPSSLTIVQGTNGTSSIAVTPQNGFTGSVTLTATGLPAGVSASFSSASTTKPGTLILAATNTATVGTFTATITGTSGALRSSATISLTIAAPPSFILTASPPSLSVMQGATGTSSITIVPRNGFTGAVVMSATGMPGGVTAAFSPFSGTLASTLTFTAAVNSSPVTATITLSGVSGSLTVKLAFALTITPLPNFSIAPAPASVSLAQGGSATSSITIANLYGFNGVVALSASGLPSGVSATFGAVTGGKSVATFTASGSAPTGLFNLALIGSSGNLTNSAKLALTITPPPNFTLTATPASLTVTPGFAGTANIAIAPLYGFTGAVTLTAAGLPSGVTATFGPIASGKSVAILSAASSTAPGPYTVTVTGVSGNLTNTAKITLTITPPPNFALSASPSAATVTPGFTGTATITITPQYSFNSPVTLAASGLPVGVTATFGAIASGKSVVTFSSATTAAAGLSTVSINGAAGSLTNSVNLALTVTPPPNFTLTATPSSATVTPGSGGASTIAILPQYGFNTPVTLAASVLPAGVSATFGPVASGKSTLVFLASATAAAGASTVTVTGTSGALTNITTISLGVTPPPNFTLTATPASVSSIAGGSVASSIAIANLNGFSGTVAFTVSGLPAGVTATFGALSSGKRPVTFTIAATAAPSTATVIITGTSSNIAGPLSNSTAINFTITPPPNFALSASPATLSIQQGASATSSITLTPQNGFAGTVTLSISALPAGVFASFSSGPAGTARLAVTITAAAATGASTTVTVTGKSGTLTQTASIGVTILPPGNGSALVNVAPFYNVAGIVSDFSTFTNGGLDAGGRAYSAGLLGLVQNANGSAFSLGPPNALDAVSNATIPLPAGNYSTLTLLATAVNGNQIGQTFTVTYTDGSTSVFTQSLSDWCAPMNYPGESRAFAMTYRNNSNATRDTRPLTLNSYTFNLAAGKTVSSITLPKNRNVVVLAMNLAAVLSAAR